MSANLIIGSSHALQFAQAVGTHTVTVEDVRERLVPLNSPSGNDNRLLYALPRPAFMSFEKTEAGEIEASFGPPMDEIRQFDTEASKVFLMLGGNEPAAYFMHRDATPYDFFLPELPQTDASRQILPLAIMKLIMATLLATASFSTETLAAQLPQARKFHVAAPPPNPSEDYIRSRPDTFDFERFGVEDRFVRLKIYRLQMQFMRGLCRKTGVTFIDPPASTVDAEGFLRPEYWSGCSHANPDYYREIVEALEL